MRVKQEARKQDEDGSDVCIKLRGSSLFAYARAYFDRSHVIELFCTGGLIYHIACGEERFMREWIRHLANAGVMLKSDVKHMLMWRPTNERTNEWLPYYCFTHASSALPPHMTHASSDDEETVDVVDGSKWINRTPGSAPSAHSATPPPLRSTQLQLGTQYTMDPSFGKHGYLLKWTNSKLLRRLRKPASTSMPTLPPSDAVAFLEEEEEEEPTDQLLRTATDNSPDHKHWQLRFCRTAPSPSDSDQHCLLLYSNHDSSTRPPTSSKHILHLRQALVLDLYALRMEVERRIRTEMESDKDAAQRNGTAVAANGSIPSHSEEDFRHRVHESLLNHPSIPQYFPASAPMGELDFALHVVRSPVSKYHYFHARTRSEKKKWMNVLRNLTEQYQYETTMRPSVSLLSPRLYVKPNGTQLQVGWTEEAEQIASPTSNDTTQHDDEVDDHVCADDETKVHVLFRDMYALLGVATDWDSLELRSRYHYLCSELKKQIEAAQSAIGTEKHQLPQKPFQAITNGHTDDPGPSSIALNGLGGTHESRSRADLLIDTSTPSNHGDVAESDSSSSSQPTLPASALPVDAPTAPHSLTFLRLHQELSMVRCAAGILLDPVRRAQYDQRREWLGIDRLIERTDAEEQYALACARKIAGIEPLQHQPPQQLSSLPGSTSTATIADNSAEAIPDATASQQSHFTEQAMESAPTAPSSISSSSSPSELLREPSTKRQRAGSTSALELIPEGKEHEEKYPIQLDTKQQEHLKEQGDAESKQPELTKDHQRDMLLTNMAELTDASPPSTHALVASASAPSALGSGTSIATLGSGSSLSIYEPTRATKWMVGDEVEVVWNSKIDDKNIVDDTNKEWRLVRMQLMRSRRLLRSVEVLSTYIPNTGRFIFRLPLKLPPGDRYFMQLSLLPEDQSSFGTDSLTPSLISQSQLFTILPLAKQENYSESLEQQTTPAKSQGHASANQHTNGIPSDGVANGHSNGTKGEHDSHHTQAAKTDGTSQPTVRMHLP